MVIKIETAKKLIQNLTLNLFTYEDLLYQDYDTIGKVYDEVGSKVFARAYSDIPLKKLRHLLHGIKKTCSKKLAHVGLYLSLIIKRIFPSKGIAKDQNFLKNKIIELKYNGVINLMFPKQEEEMVFC